MFDLLEQSKRLFTGESFSYFEAADNVHIEISTSVHMLPSTTDMLNIIDNISARDTMSITIKSVVSFRYNTGSEDWESSYTDFIEQCDPEDQADIKIHVKKEFANNTLSIYSFDMFWEYYGTGEGKDKIIPFFSDCLKKHPYLRFDVFDKPVKLVTDSIAFCSPDDNWTAQSGRNDALTKCENVSQFFNRTSISLVPMDFTITSSCGNADIAKQIFGKLETLFSLLYLADISYIMDGKVHIQFSAEHMRINYPLDSLPANQSICNIFKWAFSDQNSIDKFVIARNVIGAKCKSFNEVLSADDSMLNAIKSNYTIFQKKTTQQYIDMKKDISDFIVGASQQMQEVTSSLTDGLKNNFIAVMMFFITTILTDSLDWETLLQSGEISDDLRSIVIFILIASAIYLLVSVAMAFYKWSFYKGNYIRLKENYAGLLSNEDINQAFDGDNNYKAVRNRTLVMSVIICAAWIGVLACICFWLFQKSQTL